MRDLDENWRIVITESLHFFSFDQPSKLQVFGILNWAVALHLSLKKLLVNRKHACESHEKNICFKRSWNEWVMNGQNWSFKKKLNKNLNIDFHPFWDKQIFWTVWEWHSILWFNFCLQNAESIYLKGYD